MNQNKYLTKGKNLNKNIWQAINRGFLPCFLLALVYNASGMIDATLSGVFFSTQHIASIGIATPVILLAGSLMDIIVQGTYSNYTTCIARGQRRKTTEIFTVGLLLIAVFGTFLVMFCILFAKPIVIIFGAVNDELQRSAMRYLRYAIFALPFVTAGKFFTLILNVYGYQKYTFLANFVSFIVNISCSIGFHKLFPHLDLGAFGLGTFVSSIPIVIICYLAAKRHNLPVKLKMRKEGLAFRRIKEMVLSGITSALSDIINNQFAAVINNIIVSSSLGTNGLAVYTIMQNMWSLASVSVDGMNFSAGPMIGFCFAFRDKRGLKSALKTQAIWGAIYTVLWIFVLRMFLPSIVGLYISGEEYSPAILRIIYQNITLLFLFAPFHSVYSFITGFSDATGRLWHTVLFITLPEVIVYPLMLKILIPIHRYRGLALCLGGYTLVFLIFAYLFYMIRRKNWFPTVDELLYLDEGPCADYAMVDVTVGYDMAKISSLTEEVHHFLKESNVSSRVAYLSALCIEELATFTAEHVSDIEKKLVQNDEMSVKMISEEEEFHLILIQNGKPYNPLNFETSKKQDEDFLGLYAVQQFAKKIDYCYLYRMNMTTIQIKK